VFWAFYLLSLMYGYNLFKICTYSLTVKKKIYLPKMNKLIKLALALLSIAFSFTACVDDSLITKDDNSNTVDNFMYSTTKTIELNVAVNDTYNSDYFYKVEVFDQNPFKTDTTVNLLTAGVAKGNSPFAIRLAIPQHVSTIYIRQTDPLQHKTVKAYSIDNSTNSLSCDFSAIVAIVAVHATAAAKVSKVIAPKATNYTLPASYNTIGSSAITLDGENYYVPAGTTNSDISYGWKSNSALYVAGEVVFSQSLYIPGDCKLVVLPGGKVTFNTSAVFDQSGIIVAVHPSATLTLNQSGGVGNNSKLFNDGTTNMTTSYEIRTNGEIINNGILNGYQLTLTNSAQFVNNLNATFSSAFIMNSNTTFENNGTFEATGTIRTNNTTAVITNNSHIKTNYLDMSSGGGQIINNCSIMCEDFAMEGATISSSAGTIISCQDLYVNNSTITLNGNAIFNTAETAGNASNAVQSGVTFNYGVVINGVAQGSDKPLFKVWQLNKKDQSWMVLKLDGTMEYSLAAGNTPSSNYYNVISVGISFVESPTVVIASTDCNGGGVNVAPPVEQPTSPTFPIVVKEDNAYTFAMEDMWPHLGDYDMNDIVFKINNIKKTINTQNLVTAMSFDITPLAAGSTFRLSAGLQFDEIAPNNISVSSTNSESYLESNQTSANIILFPDVHKLFGKSTPSITNTYSTVAKTTAQKITYTVSFTTAVSADKLIIDKLNFYSIVGEINSSDRHEIHLAGFSPSSKVQSATTNYKDANNMVWGIMIPVDNFKYPTESTKIYDAYPMFKIWENSKGVQSTDWYLHPSTNTQLVYSK